MRYLLLFILLVPFNAQARINVFACEPEWKYIADKIGGSDVRTFSATTSKQNPHYISAKPSLIAKMRRADIVFCSGSDLETGWLPVLLKSAGKKQVQVGNKGYFMAADQVDLLGVIEDVSLIDRSLGDIHPFGNPHVHLDPNRYVKVAKNFTARLAELDAQNSTKYTGNFVKFEHDLLSLSSKLKQQAISLKGKKVITYHANFDYLADWLEFDLVDTIESKPGISPSSRHLAKLVSKYKNTGVHKIIYTSYESGKPARWLSDKIGVEAVQLLYNSKDDMPKVFEQMVSKLK